MKRILQLLLLAWLCSIGTAFSQGTDWTPVDQALGGPGKTEDGVQKYLFPRTDLNVSIKGVKVDPHLVLTSWAAFQGAGDKGAMLMSDLVLLEAELPAVLAAVAKTNLEVTGIHNHLAGDSPKVIYLHLGGHGDPAQLAQSIKAALAATKTPPTPALPPPPDPAADWTAVENVFGGPGDHKGKLLGLKFAKPGQIQHGGMTINPHMGAAHMIKFQPIDATRAAAAGELVLLAEQVNPALKVLVQNGLDVSALHNHMLNETPRLFYIHFFKVDDPTKLANSIKAVLTAIGEGNLKPAAPSAPPAPGAATPAPAAPTPAAAVTPAPPAPATPTPLPDGMPVQDIAPATDTVPATP